MNDKSSKSGSVEKALEILECFDRKNPFLTLDEISERTGFSRSTAFRMICSLEKFGYIKRKQTSGEVQFSLGWSFIEKSHLVVEQMDLREAARDIMKDLRDETGLSVQLAIRDGLDAVYIDKIESLKPIRVYPEIGRRAPLYAAACPRVLLAFLPENEQTKLLIKFAYRPITEKTMNSIEQIQQQLQTIKEKGYEISKGELHEGTIAIAVPIFDHYYSAVASLSVIGLENDFSEGSIQQIIEALNRCSANISFKLKGM
ncbi:IclR family transcriptional regulator [Neobacillus sp. SAB-20_R2A]|uniref:IclR family transcriptional regulator n=1 Tax=Neobacillus sp. SAB-20_R2A TaxID=3120519 RepID=UPI003C6E04D7